MSMRLHVAAIHGSNEQGKYCSSGSAAILLNSTQLKFIENGSRIAKGIA